MLKPPTDTWPTYNGDYSGRRYSTLSQINDTNVKNLKLAWMYRLNPGPDGFTGNGQVKSTPLEINGVLYFTVPDHVWAIDARTGHELWHYHWQSKGGIHIGNRGVGVYGNWLFFETPDCHLVSLNMKDGKERWNKEICDLEQEYYASVAPVVVGNHVMVGVSGDDLDIPGYLESRDPETGELQWRFYTEPQNGRAGFGNMAQRGRHGARRRHDLGAGTYDPELNLIYLGTGQSAAGTRGTRPGGRQSLHRVDCRAESGHRKTEVAFPAVAARHSRLGRGRKHRSCLMAS